MLVTFDDGYQSVRTVALPVLEKYRVPAAVFLTTGPIARRELFWYDALAVARGEQTVEPLKSAPYQAWLRAVASIPCHRRGGRSARAAHRRRCARTRRVDAHRAGRAQ